MYNEKCTHSIHLLGLGSFLGFISLVGHFRQVMMQDFQCLLGSQKHVIEIHLITHTLKLPIGNFQRFVFFSR
jgi:hypothetical protein